LVALIIGGVLVTAAADAQPRTTRVDIASMQPGTAPPGFEFALTGGGPISAWKVVADPTAAAQKAIAQISQDRTDYRFPLAVYQPITAKDVDVTVHFKPVEGKLIKPAASRCGSPTPIITTSCAPTRSKTMSAFIVS
jgi:hypothetical protein